jgi:helix-turn-helix protein
VSEDRAEIQSDPEHDAAVNEAMMENVRLGYFEVVGERNGDPLFRVTEKGVAHVRDLLKRGAEERGRAMSEDRADEWTMASPAEPVIGQILYRARKQRGWTLRHVGRLCELQNAHISQIERGVIKRPDLIVLTRLVRAYNLNLKLMVEWAGFTDQYLDELRSVLREVER